jgi:hypothetical protein
VARFFQVSMKARRYSGMSPKMCPFVDGVEKTNAHQGEAGTLRREISSRGIRGGEF